MDLFALLAIFDIADFPLVEIVIEAAKQVKLFIHFSGLFQIGKHFVYQLYSLFDYYLIKKELFLLFLDYILQKAYPFLIFLLLLPFFDHFFEI